MSRYVIPMANQTIIADSEMVIMRAATAYSSRGSLLMIFRIECSQSGTSTSQQLAVRWGLKASAFGTYTSTTPVPLLIGGVASALTGSTSNAASSAGTDASVNGAGTLTVAGQQGFNNLNGFEKIFVPEDRPIVGPDLTFVLQLQGTPTTLTGWNAAVYYEELT
jgi:hypothetical protein